MAERTCDLCGAPVEWTADQVVLDVSLRLSGLCEGLGVMCDTCGDKANAADLAAMEREAGRG